jgi:hypothetical protein
MSSRISQRLQAWILALISLVLFVWYANHQLLYSLRFGYQVLTYFFPGLIPVLRGGA